MSYVELHARSAFSFLEGASLPEELVSICADYQMPAIALLDCNGFYGSPRFHLGASTSARKWHRRRVGAIPCWWSRAPAIKTFAASLPE